MTKKSFKKLFTQFRNAERKYMKSRIRYAKKKQIEKTGKKRGWNLRSDMIDGDTGRFLGRKKLNLKD